MKILTVNYRSFFLSLAIWAAIISLQIGNSQFVYAETNLFEGPLLPLVDVSKRKAELNALPRAERYRLCEYSIRDQLPGKEFLETESKVSGQVRRQYSNANQASHELFQLVESYYFGVATAPEMIREFMEIGAAIQAFTKIKPYTPPDAGYQNYNKLNEPTYQAANFMNALAHAYLILQAEYPEDKNLLSNVKSWGDQIHNVTYKSKDDFKPKAYGIDRRALIAAGWASWGNVTKNKQVLERAYKYYKKSLKGTKKGGIPSLWRRLKPKDLVTYYANMTSGAGMVAAFALHQSGITKAYSVKSRGSTIVDDVARVWERLEEENHLIYYKYRTSGSRGIG